MNTLPFMTLTVFKCTYKPMEPLPCRQDGLRFGNGPFIIPYPPKRVLSVSPFLWKWIVHVIIFLPPMSRTTPPRPAWTEAEFEVWLRTHLEVMKEVVRTPREDWGYYHQCEYAMAKRYRYFYANPKALTRLKEGYETIGLK